MDLANLAMNTAGLEAQTELNRVKPELFIQPEETELWDAIQLVKPRYETLIGLEEYSKAVESLMPLTTPINKFMDKVRVLAPTLELQRNRWNILKTIEDMTMKIGDLTKLQSLPKKRKS